MMTAALPGTFFKWRRREVRGFREDSVPYPLFDFQDILIF
jgi:hypothetical protein